MSENENANLSYASVEAMKYNDLKSKAAELSLDASGTKEDLVARITEHLGLSKDEQGAGDEGKGDTNSDDAGDSKDEGKTPPPQENKSTGKPLSETQERGEQSKADRALLTDAAKMKAALDKQKKVSIIIPFEAGENPETGKKVPFHVNLNGYAQDFPRGQYIEVPEQIAQIIKERLESEGKIGSQWRIDRDPSKVEALS